MLNNDWMRNADDSLNIDQAQGDIQGYGSAMQDMIRYYASKNRGKQVAKSVKESLKENMVKSGNLSNQLGDMCYRKPSSISFTVNMVGIELMAASHSSWVFFSFSMPTVISVTSCTMPVTAFGLFGSSESFMR